MSTSLTNQKELARVFIEREATWDSESILQLRTDDCTYDILPKALDFPVMHKEETRKFYDQLKPVWQDYKVSLPQLEVSTFLDSKLT